MPTVELSGVSVCRPAIEGGSREILADVSFDLAGGSLSLLTGGSGSGKSTLLATIAGLRAFHGGSINIAGSDLTKLGRRQLLPLIGILFQNPEKQIFASTVYDEIAFAARNSGFAAARLAAAVQDAAAAVDLDIGLMEKSPYSLSEGQRRRVAVASVIVVAPKVLLLDEPTAGLDHFGRVAITGLVKEVVTAGVCVLVATHEPADFVDVAQRVFRLESGTVREEPLEAARERFVPWLRVYHALLERGVDLPVGLSSQRDLAAAFCERMVR